MVVTLHTTVHDSRVSLFLDALLCDGRIHPVWESPHIRLNLAPLDFRAGVILYSLAESLIEIAIVQKYVWVLEPPVKMPLDRLDRLYDAIQLLVSR
jgi:hypothetical protein